MRVLVDSYCRKAHGGGSVLYALTIAGALARKHVVDLAFPDAMDESALARWYGAEDTGDAGSSRVSRPTILRSPRTRWPLIGEVALAWRERRRYDRVLRQSPWVPRWAGGPDAVLFCEFPRERRLRKVERLRLASYATVVANAHFTARWIDHRWGRTAVVLEPPVRMLQPADKKNWILAVGRFQEGGRSKRQREMVECFRDLVDAGLHGWELHLAGFAADDAYVETVRAAAEGLPVRFHLAPERAEVEALYARASIFWHATGLGVDPEEEPERLEHFGIVTAEAMSAGCVPIVYGQGGQPEIVAAPENGVLWQTPEAWRGATLALAEDEPRRHAMATAARQRARVYDADTFADRLEAALGMSGSEPA